jgi:hypothetical protein
MRKKYLNTFLLSIAIFVLILLAIKIGGSTFHKGYDVITSNKQFDQVKEGNIRSVMPLWQSVARHLFYQN